MRIVVVCMGPREKVILRQAEKNMHSEMLHELEDMLLRAVTVEPMELPDEEDLLPEMTGNWAFAVRACVRRLIGHLIPWYTSGFE